MVLTIFSYSIFYTSIMFFCNANLLLFCHFIISYTYLQSSSLSINIRYYFLWYICINIIITIVGVFQILKCFFANKIC